MKDYSLTRLGEFRQLKKEIRGSDKHLIIGIDVAKDSANVADLLSQGKFLYYDLPSPPIRNLRNLLSLKKKLKAHEHSTKMRIRNHLVSQFFPELDKAELNSLPARTKLISAG